MFFTLIQPELPYFEMFVTVIEPQEADWWMQSLHVRRHFHRTHPTVLCVQGWEGPTGRHLPEERPLSEDVFHVHPRVRQECRSTGRADKEKPSVRCVGAGIWGNATRSTCFVHARGGRCGLCGGRSSTVYLQCKDAFVVWFYCSVCPGQSSLCQPGAEALPAEAGPEDSSVPAAAHRYIQRKRNQTPHSMFSVRKSNSAWLQRLCSYSTSPPGARKKENLNPLQNFSSASLTGVTMRVLKSSPNQIWWRNKSLNMSELWRVHDPNGSAPIPWNQNVKNVCHSALV